jgi:hypothetical protein
MKNLNDLDLVENFFATNQQTAVVATTSQDSLSLADFNLLEILRTNSMLLSSDTQKYDGLKEIVDASVTIATNASCTPNQTQLNEKIKQQRNILNLKLGIDVAGAAKLDTSHIFSDYDIISSTCEQQLVAAAAADESSHKRKLVAADGGHGGESAARLTPPFIPTCAKVDSEGSKKIKMEPGDVTTMTTDEPTVSPVRYLEEFTRWLQARLFSPEWEIRHGSATCLREIIKKLVACLLAASASATGAADAVSLPLDWFETCLYKLLKVIALDRFADYIGDEVVAPVRETCTQIVGVISQLYTRNFADTRRLCSVVNMFLTSCSSNTEAASLGNYKKFT